MGRKKANQDRLPGVEGGIPELDQLGYEYAALRDSRMETLKKEVELKKKTLDAMKRHNLMTYRYEDLIIDRVPGEEKLRVKVAKEEGGEEAA